MPAHDHFLELGTLAAAGQISEAEDRELCEHCAECSACRDAYADYLLILSRHLPNLNPVRHRLRNQFVHPSTPEDIRERFLARARQQGAEFSAEVEVARPQPRAAGLFTPGRLAFALATILVVAGAVWMTERSRSALRHQSHQIDSLAASNQKLKELLDQAGHATQLTPPVIQVEADPEAEHLRAQVEALTQQVQLSAQRTKAIEGQLAALRSQNESLSGSHQQDQASIKDLQEELVQEKDTSTSTIAALIEAQERIRILNTNLKDGNERLAMERQLSSVSSDVRQLMGARNLHIIDVHDVNPSGQTNKAFGRVFYAENQSLVFYAFDLPSSKSAKYTFQAWGQTEANERSIHNIGTFSVDDHEQRRWVLKVKDPALLKGIDSVFVTAETTGNPNLPKGKRVLYAYFAGQANHP